MLNQLTELRSCYKLITNNYEATATTRNIQQNVTTNCIAKANYTPAAGCKQILKFPNWKSGKQIETHFAHLNYKWFN